MSPRLDFSQTIGFEWDQGNKQHIKKHEVTSKECEDVFFNKPLVLNIDESHSQTEERFRVYGRTNSNRFLFVIFTVRNNKIRIISAKDQSRKERSEFNEKIKKNT